METNYRIQRWRNFDKIRFTGFYGHLEEFNRPLSWDLLRGILDEDHTHWFSMGGIKKILFFHEKQGGRLRDERCIKALRAVIQYCDLLNLGFEGRWYTWE
ncbi:non-ltr retroelement reverse transcriptase [Gossypium australe]|uniref:Non-ltr retroelement reverse transcriptase n=1 Tax=Gossypium australe TaxID=47621 RepID=A0A5B6VZE3_9ROSI|nr:non-ltr retroelement reverse transcriptase [Gossypium australe]